MWLFRFLFRNNGILFENELIQVGVKSEFRNNLGVSIMAVCVSMRVYVIVK